MDEEGVTPTRHKLSADDYYLAAEAGVLKPEDRVELIEGEIIDMAPIGQDHESVVMAFNERLVLACHGRAIVSTQNSLRLGRWSAPQPDFAALRTVGHRGGLDRRREAAPARPIAARPPGPKVKP